MNVHSYQSVEGPQLICHSHADSKSVRLEDAVGPGTEDTDAASVRADHSVPFASGMYYFEIEVRL